jgi:hypothetical protein
MLRKLRFSTAGLTIAVLVAGLSLIPVARLEGQAKGSLSELDIENSQLKVNLEKALAENKQLQDALAIDSKELADMRKNLATVSGESEVFKRKAMESKLLIEALGLEASSGNVPKVQERLLTAVSDMRAMAEEKKKLSEALVRLSEAASLYAKTAPSTNPEIVAALEAELRNTRSALGIASPNAVEASAVPASISDGMAISVRDDLALVVVNLGSKQGVKIGMPFQVIRGDHIVGSVRVVDVREKIAGALIQNLTTEKDRIQVGDRLKVEARQARQ